MNIKKSQLKTLIRGIIEEAVNQNMPSRSDLDVGVMKAVNVEENEFNRFKYPKHNAKVTPEEMEEAKTVASKIFQPVYLTQFHSTGLKGWPKFFEILLHSATGDKHWICKTKEGKWMYSTGNGAESRWVSADEYLKEMTSTGAVAGYSTPFAFSKKGSQGSNRAIKAAKKYGTVVKSISEEEK